MGDMLNFQPPSRTGRLIIFVTVALLVAGVVAIAVWQPTANHWANRSLTGSALSLAADAPIIDVSGGDPSRGPAAMRANGCIACHTVPGVPGAQGTVGPPLTDFANRAYIAGMLPNDPDNLIYWIQHPQDVVPGNDMPDLGVSDQDARDIASYLYTLSDD